MNFFRNMSALSARRRFESSNIGLLQIQCRCFATVSAGPWSRTMVGPRRDSCCRARDRGLTMGGPAAPACTRAQDKRANCEIELYECRGVTNCERLCQFAGRTAVKSLRRATLYQDMPYSEGADFLKLGGQCDYIIAHLCEFVKRAGFSFRGVVQIVGQPLSESGLNSY